MRADPLVHIGHILGAHGVKGLLSIYSYTRPAAGIAEYHLWQIGQSKHSTRCYPIRRCWQHGKRLLAELEDIRSCEDAEALQNAGIWINHSDIRVSGGDYLWVELQGCSVYSDAGEKLGIVSGLQEYGAQDILCIETEGSAPRQGEWMLPFTEEVILAIDLEADRIDVQLPEGIDVCFKPRS